MQEIKKVSDITTTDLVDYIRIPDADADDLNFLKTILPIAKKYVQKYTGVDDLDTQSDFIIAVLILCQDMWDNRTKYVDSNNISDTLMTILGMHSINLL